MKYHLRDQKTYIKLAVLRKGDISRTTWRVVRCEEDPRISILTGKVWGEKEFRPYTYRFPVSDFNLKTAREWLSQRGIQEIRHSSLMVSLNESFQSRKKTRYE